mgnify:CR=1 FL=1|tara:strand:+ start:24 stop:560 length:537 start_codon:yes stop_codon:yes gene_type:complete
MPGHTDKGTKNYRDMMKRMEKDDPSIVNPARPSGMMGGTPADLIKSKPEETAMGRMGAGTREVFNMMKTLDPKSVVREGEMAGMSGVEDAMSGLTMADREAIEALTTMGISLEDAIEAVMGNMQDSMVEGAVGATMGGGTLGALPMARQGTVEREGEMGADRTENPMNTITSRNAPST